MSTPNAESVRAEPSPLELRLAEVLVFMPGFSQFTAADLREVIRRCTKVAVEFGAHIDGSGAPPRPDLRHPECVKAWPECVSGGYDPRCCRFPKSCSCER